MGYGELKVWTEEWDGTPVIGAQGEVDLGNVDGAGGFVMHLQSATEPLQTIPSGHFPEQIVLE